MITEQGDVGRQRDRECRGEGCENIALSWRQPLTRPAFNVLEAAQRLIGGGRFWPQEAGIGITHHHRASYLAKARHDLGGLRSNATTSPKQMV